MEKKLNQPKKAWTEPTLMLISSGNINNGTHPTFKEVSLGATPLTFVIEKNTPLHKVYHTSIGGWNFAGLS
ncbi:hypothetical protein ACFGVR_01160 [Mucilaginibacter sp. AW1-3]